jgi:hypothetical protein
VGVDQREVRGDATLEDEGLAIELLVPLALRDVCADDGAGVEAGDAGAPRTQPLRERALRAELHLERAVEMLLREQLVLADVRGTWLFSSGSPRPLPPTPILLDTIARSRTPLSRTASIRSRGMPQSPKPPTAIVIPSRTRSATAVRGPAASFLIGCSFDLLVCTPDAPVLHLLAFHSAPSPSRRCSASERSILRQSVVGRWRGMRRCRAG